MSCDTMPNRYTGSLGYIFASSKASENCTKRHLEPSSSSSTAIARSNRSNGGTGGARRYCRQAFCAFWSGAHDRLTDEMGSGIPFGVFGKDRNDIPKDSL